MKICLVTDTFPPIVGGSSIFAKQLVEGLTRKRNEVFVIAPGRFPNDTKDSGIKIFRIPIFYPAVSPSNVFALIYCIVGYFTVLFKGKKFFFDKEIDIIVADDFLAGIIGNAIKKITRKPLILYIFLLSSDKFLGRVLRAIAKIVIKRSKIDKIVCLSSPLERDLNSWDVKNTVYVPCGVEVEKFSPFVVSDAKGRFNVKGKLIITNKQLYITNALGIIYVLRSLPIIHQEIPNTYLMILGDGVGRSLLKQEAKRLGIEDFVIFAGNIKHEEMPRFLAAADVIVHSYAYEPGASISVLEAMSMAKPNVITECGELAQTLNRDEVVFVRPRDPPSIAHGVLQVLKNQTLYSKYGKNSRLRVERDYSLNTFVDRFERILKEHIEG